MSVKFQTKTTVSHWTDEFYRRIDASDPSSGELWADDAYIECANFPPTYSKAAAFAPGSGFPRIVAAIRGVKHDLLDRWDVSPDEVICRFRVNYTRLDGRVIRLPAITTLRRNAAGLIDDLRLSIDLGPLFAGLTARVVHNGSMLVNPPDQKNLIERQDVWESLTRDPAGVLRFAEDIDGCQVVDQGTDAQGRKWLLREIIIDKVCAQERVVFEPEARITITRTRAEQRGDIHLLLNGTGNGLVLSIQFDLLWDGIAEGSYIAPILGEELKDRYINSFNGLLTELRR